MSCNVSFADIEISRAFRESFAEKCLLQEADTQLTCVLGVDRWACLSLNIEFWIWLCPRPCARSGRDPSKLETGHRESYPTVNLYFRSYCKFFILQLYSGEYIFYHFLFFLISFFVTTEWVATELRLMSSAQNFTDCAVKFIGRLLGLLCYPNYALRWKSLQPALRKLITYVCTYIGTCTAHSIEFFDY